MYIHIVLEGPDDVVETSPGDTVLDFKRRIAEELSLTEGVFEVVMSDGATLDDDALPMSEVGLCGGDSVSLRIEEHIKARELLRKLGITQISNETLAPHAQSGAKHIVALMLETGLADGVNLLIRSASTAQTALCELLISCGVSPNASSFESAGKTPLAASLLASCYSTAEVLVELGADVNCVCPVDGDTPLMQVSSSVGGIAFLIRHGADINFRDRNSCTALQRSIACGSVACCRLLIEEGADFQTTSDCGASPLWYSLAQGKAACSAVLIEAGADVNRAGPYGETPLMQASLQTSSALSALLLQHNADVNKSDESGITALTRALDAGRMDTCELLLSAGAVLTRSASAKLGLADNSLVARLRRRGGRPRPFRNHSSESLVTKHTGNNAENTGRNAADMQMASEDV